MTEAWLNMILRGGRVTRFHTKPVLKEETVADHSFLVAWLCALMHSPKVPRAELLLAALAHDLPEYELGDMPSPAKRRLGLRAAYRAAEASMFQAAGMPDYEEALTPREAEILKFADNLAGYLKAVYEVRLGNNYLVNTVNRYKEYLDQQVRTSTVLPGRCEALLRLAQSQLNHVENFHD